MKLILHIGTPKTGTTSMQRWFAQNRAALTQQGIRYARAPGAENHRRLMAYARDTDKPDESFARFGITSDESHAAFRNQLQRAIAREVEAHPGMRCFVMSNEHIYSKIDRRPMAERLHALLAPLFDEIEVWLHLRPQVDLLMSNASQLIRMGRHITAASLSRPAIAPDNRFYGYGRFLDEWEPVFGAGNIRLIPFRRRPDITRALIEDLGIDMTGLTEPERVNTALDWRAVALGNTINRSLAAAGHPQRVDYFIDEMPGREKVQPGRAQARQIHTRFEEANRALEARHPELPAADLTPDWDAYPEEGNLHLLDTPCPFEPQLGHMVRRFTEELLRERWLRHSAELRLAQQRKDTAAVQRQRQKRADVAKEMKRLGIEPPAPGPATAKAADPAGPTKGPQAGKPAQKAKTPRKGAGKS
ncbi:hypothetical protein D2N39_18465 [Gemmobacter lutimaris]|uniref:Sulfotransferase family protein n=1 Tax=Gemmobacter lutimaris TaxID=2306023 RepID=A0A398BR24_9RHOB|nr:hypothetical protein [Gemmobacter lutimaris]RID90350.1 hypothetical protein D2N39_18465 [Gemmobacter lutimaris]